MFSFLEDSHIVFANKNSRFYSLDTVFNQPLQ